MQTDLAESAVERLSDLSNLDTGHMSTVKAIDSKDRATLAKVRALFDSPVPGEVSAAQGRAAAILKKYGKTIGDIDVVLSAVEQAKPAGFDFFSTMDDEIEKKHPGWKAEQAQWRADRARAEVTYRDEVLAKYGSEEAAQAPSPMEKDVEDAVAHLKRKVSKKYANGIFEVESLDGWTDGSEAAPDHVRRAVEEALPLPVTIQQAKAEYDLWEERDRELEAAYGRTGGNSYLSIACGLRRTIVCELLETGLRARTITDALARQRYLVMREFSMPEVEKAVLADLEHLAAMAEMAPERSVQTGHVHNGQRETTTDRRAEVIRLLSNVDTAHLSDREIARRVGVSPQTVGNIRRRLADEDMAKAA
jgi:hypothetical protein